MLNTITIRDGSNMNLSQLYYFKRLAELQHYTKAAQELSITQPSLSGAIHSLEDELGVDLFHKKGRNIVLTKNGSEFYVYVSCALRELDKGVDIMQERASKLKGRIEVGCVNALLSEFLPRVVNEFRSQAGSYVQVRAHMEQTERILENVQSGKWDLGFCSYVEGYPEIEYIPIYKQQLVVATMDGGPFASQASLKLDDLEGMTALSYHVDMPIGRDIQKLIGDRRIDMEYNCSAEEAIIGAMRVHECISILLKTPFVVNSPGIRLLEIENVPDDFHVVQMVYNRKLQKQHAVDSFIEYLSCNYRNYSDNN